MSNAQPENLISDTDLISIYQLNQDVDRDQKHMDMLRFIHNLQIAEESELPAKMDDFVVEASRILESSLSDEEVSHNPEVDDKPKEPGLEDEKESKKNSGILHDAKALFKEHVIPVFKDTKKDLLSGSALRTLGTILSLPGRLINGISKFWGEFIKKRPLLRELEKIIVTPLVIAAAVNFLPAVGIIKACELVGRTMCAYSKAEKGEKWSAVQNAASDMIGDTLDHMDRIVGVNNVAPFVKQIDRANFSDDTKTLLKTSLTSVQAMRSIEGFEKNPKTFGALMAGITLASKSSGIDLQDSILLAGMILSGKKEGKKIDIKALVADENARHVASHFVEIFGVKGILPSSQNLKSTIAIIQDSKKVNDEIKSNMIEAVVASAVRSEITSGIQIAGNASGEHRGKFTSQLSTRNLGESRTV